MEKINNVLEWPKDVRLAYWAFALGLLDPRSPVSCLCLYIVRKIGYELISSLCFEHIPRDVPMFAQDDSTISALYVSEQNWIEVPKTFKIADLKHRKCKFVTWTDGNVQSVWKRRGYAALATMVRDVLAPDDLRGIEYTFNYMHCHIGEFAWFTGPDGFFYAFTVFISRKDVPLYKLLRNSEPNGDTRCAMASLKSGTPEYNLEFDHDFVFDRVQPCEQRTCRAKTRSGRRCARWTLCGSDYCRQHANIPHIKREAIGKRRGVGLTEWALGDEMHEP